MVVRLGIGALVLSLCAGCWSVDMADLNAIAAEQGIALSESECDEGTVIPMGSIQVAKGGFYLFGLLGVVSIDLHESIEVLAKRAKKVGADGVCDIRYHYDPAHPLKFLVFPIPDWSARIQVFGMAYKFKPDDPRAKAAPQLVPRPAQ